MTYNETLIENATGIGSMAYAVNEWSGGLLGILLLVVVSLVSFASTRRQDTPSSLVFITFTNATSSILLYFGNLVKQEIVMSCLALLVGAIFFYVLTTD